MSFCRDLRSAERDAVPGLTVPSVTVTGYDDDLRLAHVIADQVDALTMSRFQAADLRAKRRAPAQSRNGTNPNPYRDFNLVL